MTIKERLAILEVLIKNHLKHHEIMNKCLLLPILGALIIILIRVFILK